MIMRFFDGEIKEVKGADALTLAYIGDAVQTLYVRESLAESGFSVGRLHKEASAIVNAGAQAAAAERLLPLFTPDEEDVYRRGRNHRSGTIPKNADVIDYKKATGLEAVIGYLYLTGQTERLRLILKEAGKWGK